MPVLSTLGGASASGFALNRLAAAAAIGPTDEFFANVSLLINADGLADGSTALVDESNNNHAINVAGDAQVDTAVVKYGSGSIKFDGTGDYLQLPVSQSLELGSEDFTIEGWINAPSPGGSYQSILSIGYAVQIYLREETIEVYFNDQDNTSSYIIDGLTGPSNSISANTWAHFAVVRSGSTFKVYIDGVSDTSDNNSSTVSSSSVAPGIGIFIDTLVLPYTGYIDDFRITKGVARYTANFTPPAAELPTQ